MEDRPTAKTFREPALRALGRLSKLVPGAEVAYTDVCQQVLQEMGVSENAYGVQEGSGRPWLYVWIGWAATRILREEGLLELVKGTRGKWVLTPEGATAAKVLLLGAQEDTPPSGALFSPVEMADTYNTDPYLRALAIGSTSCMGHRDTSAKVCQACPLGATCRHLTCFRMARLGDALGEPPEPPEPPETTPSEPLPEDAVEDIEDPDLLGAVDDLEQAPPGALGAAASIPYTVKQDSVCYVCQQPIPKNTKCLWSKAGVRHLTCTEKKP